MRAFLRIALERQAATKVRFSAACVALSNHTRNAILAPNRTFSQSGSQILKPSLAGPADFTRENNILLVIIAPPVVRFEHGIKACS